jgi:hypothetical protein
MDSANVLYKDEVKYGIRDFTVGKNGEYYLIVNTDRKGDKGFGIIGSELLMKEKNKKWVQIDAMPINGHARAIIGCEDKIYFLFGKERRTIIKIKEDNEWLTYKEIEHFPNYFIITMHCINDHLVLVWGGLFYYTEVFYYIEKASRFKIGVSLVDPITGGGELIPLTALGIEIEELRPVIENDGENFYIICKEKRYKYRWWMFWSQRYREELPSTLVEYRIDLEGKWQRKELANGIHTFHGVISPEQKKYVVFNTEEGSWFQEEGNIILICIGEEEERIVLGRGTDPRLVYDSEGKLNIFWRQREENGGKYKLVRRIYNEQKKLLSPIEIVVDNMGSSEFYYHRSRIRSGEAYIVKRNPATGLLVLLWEEQGKIFDKEI